MISCYLWFYGNLWNVLFSGVFWISQHLAKWWTTEVTQGNLAPRYIICHPKLPQSRLESDKPALKCNYQNLQACNSLHRHRTSVNTYIFFLSVGICYTLWTEKHICKHVNTDHPLFIPSTVILSIHPSKIQRVERCFPVSKIKEKRTFLTQYSKKDYSFGRQMLREKIYLFRGNIMRNTINKEPSLGLVNRSEYSFVRVVEDQPGRNTVWILG